MVRADWKDEIGFTELAAGLGVSTPTGAGVAVSMGEARVTTAATETIPATIKYLPNPGSSELSHATIIDGTGVNVGINSHADGVANLFFGKTQSIAPGVTQVTAFDADSWLNIQLGFSATVEPLVHPFQVQNHSWIANAPETSGVLDLAMRTDYVVERDNILIVGGSTNGGATPDLLAHSYNAIGVGVTDGDHGNGPTTFYGAGRPRPDIVAPAANTSSATPMVSSAAAML